MAKLDIEIVVPDDAFGVLKALAINKFKANGVYEISGSDTLDIDDGLNDIRAKIDSQNRITFFIRYPEDSERYLALIREFCEKNGVGAGEA